MAKAQKKTANVAMETLAKMAGLLVEAASDADVAAVLEAAGLTVAAKGKGKGAKGKPEAKAKPAAKGKKKKVTAAQIVEAISEEEEIDLEGVEEDVLREAVIGAKLASKKKAGSLDEEELLELLQEALGQDSDDEDEEDEEDEDEDDSDDEDEDEDEDDSDDEDEDEDEDDEDSDDEDEDEDDEDEDEDDEDEDETDLDDLDEDQLRALAVEEGLLTKAKAKKMDEEELREALEAHFAGDEDEDEDEDEDDEDFDDEDEDEDDE